TPSEAAAPAPVQPAAAPLGELLARMRAMLPPGMSPASPAALPFDPEQVRLPEPPPGPGSGPTAGPGEPQPKVHVLAFLQAGPREALAVYRADAPVPGGAVGLFLRVRLEGAAVLPPLRCSERRL